MAVNRQQNWLGQQRIDAPHLRMMESAVAGDFDALAGTIIGGKKPLIVNGYKLISTGVVRADQLQLEVASAAVLHFNASESGSIFMVPADRAPEVLSTTNTRVVGGFQPGQTNYIGVDFIRQADYTTTDLVMFLNADTNLETPKEVPLARTTDYRITITTAPFESLPGVCPIAKVVTNSANEIVSIEDARSLAFRLGSGGTVPNTQHAYAWPTGRKETTAFVGADKDITNQKDWMDAVMTRLWEVGSGEYWYSPTADRNMRMIHRGSPFSSTGEFFEWDGTNLHWTGLGVLFENSTGYVNEVLNQTGNAAGLTDLADGECIYVDLDRTQNRTGGSGLQATKAVTTTLGAGAVPGSRVILAWRYGSSVFTRDQGYSVGSSFKIATLSAHGTVKVTGIDSVTPGSVRAVAHDSTSGAAIAAGLSRGAGGTTPYLGLSTPGPITIGGQAYDGQIQLVGVAGDITMTQATSPYAVTITAPSHYFDDKRSPLEITNSDDYTSHTQNRTLTLKGKNGSTIEDSLTFDACGTIGFRLIAGDPAVLISNPIGSDPTSPIRVKVFAQKNDFVSVGDRRDRLCVMWWDGSVTIIAESPRY